MRAVSYRFGPNVNIHFQHRERTISPMSRADRIKEALGWLKVVFVALVAVDVSLIAWLAQNFQSADNVLVVLTLVAVVCTTAAIIGVNHAAYKRIAELENL